MLCVSRTEQSNQSSLLSIFSPKRSLPFDLDRETDPASDAIISLTNHATTTSATPIAKSMYTGWVTNVSTTDSPYLVTDWVKSNVQRLTTTDQRDTHQCKSLNKVLRVFLLQFAFESLRNGRCEPFLIHPEALSALVFIVV